MRGFRNWFLDQLGMYAAYHKDRRNQLTHYVGVPLIIFSIIIILNHARIGESFSAAVVVLSILLIAYLIAVPLVGLFSLVLCVPLYLAAELVSDMEAMHRWTVAGSCFVVGWVIQFVGHIFEGRRPAFTVNTLQVFMAPAFLAAELMFAVGLLRGLADNLEVRAQKFGRP